MANNVNIFNHRFLVRIIIEAKTPLTVGSGEKNILTNNVVVKDANGLPYIPGTSIAGIIRSALKITKYEKSFFGFLENPQNRKRRLRNDTKKSINEGSKIIFSSAHLVDEDGTVVEGLITKKSDYLLHFESLPIRQHVRIDEKGTSTDKGKFDEEVVYKGTRFCFEIEMLSPDGLNYHLFEDVLSVLASDVIRIGGSTRKGLGEIAIIDYKLKKLKLNSENKDEQSNDLSDYINKTSSLNDEFWMKEDAYWDKIYPANGQSYPIKAGDWTTYELLIEPDDFFLFSSGIGNEKADMTPVSEPFFDWSSGAPEQKDGFVLIPGSSVKGALSHRVAFRYNKINNVYADDPNVKIEDHVGDHNKAVRALFGYSFNNKKGEQETIRGNVLVSDVIQTRSNEQHKILNHVAINRFTGGAMDGALFFEEITFGKGSIYTLTFKVKNEALEDDGVKKAFHAALFDIAEGRLPLGGGVNRGHGCFHGKIFVNNEEIKRYE